jgi:HK97 gp10 family phage protein
MSVQIKKTGFNFAALSSNMRRGIADELNSGAKSAVSLAKQLSPVDTGFMRENISQTEEASPVKLRAVIESAADYSVFVEYGTVNQEAQPFFTPAFESARRQVNNGLRRVLQFGNLRSV